MPQVPFASPAQAQAQAAPDQTFMAMAAAEFIQAHRQSRATAKAPNQSEPYATADQS